MIDDKEKRGTDEKADKKAHKEIVGLRTARRKRSK
jgi:hypothetical protein